MKKKILIIEDDAVIALISKRLLEKNGYEAEVATDGAKGIDRIPVFQPDAILLDVMMPQVNGIQVLEWIRKQESLRELPVIVLTNAAVPALIAQAEKAGATRVLDKANLSPVVICEMLRGFLHTGPSNSIGLLSHAEPWKG
jgi:CheY-like chemotaxis protein